LTIFDFFDATSEILCEIAGQPGITTAGGLILALVTVHNLCEKDTSAGEFRHIQEAILHHIYLVVWSRVVRMRIVISVLLATASFLSPISAFAGSDDVEATIEAVNVDSMSLVLDDGKTYTVPAEFNFEGLESGQKVIVFYTEVDGKRVVDDLEVIQ
jgi:hypothetical protein